MNQTNTDHICINDLKKIFLKIQNSNKILIASHSDPDGDALGSINALVEHLKKEQKKYQIYCHGIIEEKFNLLPYTSEILTSKDELDYNEIDLAIILDSGDLKYSNLLELNETNIEIINIDHHEVNDFFGNINYVKPVSCTAEIIYDYFVVNKIFINKTTAQSLLTGIITDTNNFTNSGTTSTCVAAASKLISYGANRNKIIKNFLNDITIDDLKKWGQVIKQIKINEKLNIAYIVIKPEQEPCLLQKDNSLKPGLANFLNNLLDCKILVIMKQKKENFIVGCLRSTDESINLAKFGKLLGGGGHKKAAGFGLDGSLEMVYDKWHII